MVRWTPSWRSAPARTLRFSWPCVCVMGGGWRNSVSGAALGCVALRVRPQTRRDLQLPSSAPAGQPAVGERDSLQGQCLSPQSLWFFLQQKPVSTLKLPNIKFSIWKSDDRKERKKNNSPSVTCTELIFLKQIFFFLLVLSLSTELQKA